jgi:hypothetical protein
MSRVFCGHIMCVMCAATDIRVSPLLSQFVDTFAILRKASISFVMSVRPSVRSACTGRIFIKFDIRMFFSKIFRQKNMFQFILTAVSNGQLEWKRVFICGSTSLNYTQNEKYFRQVVQKIKTHFMFSNRFSENRSVREIM